MYEQTDCQKPMSTLLSPFYALVFALLSTISNFFFPSRVDTSDQACTKYKIAIIGAGITGVSAAAHCVSHGIDVKIFEAGPRKNLGGVWTRVNESSGLQIHSDLYRFHPSVVFDNAFPGCQRILEEVEKLWVRYGLGAKTVFDTPVKLMCRTPNGRWMINGDEKNCFDGVIAAVGTCGSPSMPYLQGEERFQGPIIHSSELDGLDVRGKRVMIVGDGASAAEVIEHAVAHGAKSTHMLGRTERWIIPRNLLVCRLLSSNFLGKDTWLSFIPEYLLTRFFYRDLQYMAPSKTGIYSTTPVCNDQILNRVRSGEAHWLRGDIKSVDQEGIHFNHRQKGIPPNGPGEATHIEGDIIVKATGFKRPSLDFLPTAAFTQAYKPPAWYLQTFPPGFPEICAINSVWVKGIGTVGNMHIGMYTRTLLMFLLDARTKPTTGEMSRWVDLMSWRKSTTPSKAFEFYTYSEMLLWFFELFLWSPKRWAWAAFVLFGMGSPRVWTGTTSTKAQG